jgi:hypothetical protein
MQNGDMADRSLEFQDVTEEKLKKTKALGRFKPGHATRPKSIKVYRAVHTAVGQPHLRP